MAQRPQQYFVVVELRDYDGNKIAESSCTCGSDISDANVISAARVAGELMMRHHTGIKAEHRKIIERLDRQIANLPNSEN